jgi:hypothetical protein
MLVTTSGVASVASIASHASAASVASSSSVTSFALPAFQHHRRFSHIIILKKSSQSVGVVLLSDRANGRLRVLICVGSGTHVSLEVLKHCFVDQMTLCQLSSCTSHKPQPCDNSVFTPPKIAYRDDVKRLERGVYTVGK